MPTSSELFLAEYKYLANYTCTSTDVSLYDEADESNGAGGGGFSDPFNFRVPWILIGAVGAAAVVVPTSLALIKRNKTKVEVSK